MVGNILAIVILRNPVMKTTFHQSLIALASCDLALLGLVLLDFTANFARPFYILILPYFLNPFKEPNINIINNRYIK